MLDVGKIDVRSDILVSYLVKEIRHLAGQEIGVVLG